MYIYAYIYIYTYMYMSKPITYSASQPTSQPASQPASQPTNPTQTNHHPASPPAHKVRGSDSYLAKVLIIGLGHATAHLFKSIVFYRCDFTPIGDGKSR